MEKEFMEEMITALEIELNELQLQVENLERVLKEVVPIVNEGRGMNGIILDRHEYHWKQQEREQRGDV